MSNELEIQYASRLCERITWEGAGSDVAESYFMARKKNNGWVSNRIL
jgi:hypothetical protein